MKTTGARLLSLLDLLILAGAYVALVTLARGSTWSLVTSILGGVFVGIAALLTLVDRVSPQWLRSPSSPAMRAALAVAPWMAVVMVIAIRGLWWSQRPAVLRFFALYALANWSVWWCLGGSRSRQAQPIATSGYAVIILAGVLGALGIEGAAFGVTPFGCAASAAVAAVASFALAVACFGARAAHFKVFAASLATLIAVSLVEVTVRLLHIGHNVEEVDTREYAREFYSLTPPRSAFVNDPKTLDEFPPALIEINTLGIRGPELPNARADVLLIGDSMIEARQLPWPETLGPALQEALKAHGSSLRVVAHGMRGWSPLLEWNWYLKIGRRLQPKTIMLFFFWNDLWTSGDEVSTFNARLRGDGRPDHFDVPVDSNWIWYKHVRVVRLAADVWHRLSVAEVRRAFATMTSPGTRQGSLDDAAAERLARTLTEPPLTAAQLNAVLATPESELDPDLRMLARASLWPSLRPWNLWTNTQRFAAARTESELQHFAEDVAADGGRLVIVYVPNPLQVGPSECGIGRLFERVDTNVLLPPDSGIQMWLRGVTERHGIEFLDPSAAMREFDRARTPNDSAPLYLRADCHWSERGHRFMADYLAEWCRQHTASTQQ